MALPLAFLALALTSCAPSSSPIVVAAPVDHSVVRRALPPAPAFAAPVQVAEPQPTEDAYLVAARERLGRLKANERIVAFARWYSTVRASYAR